MSTQDTDVRKFLAKVLPQDPAGKAFVNIHWTKIVTGFAKPLWDGRAHHDVSNAAGTVEWIRDLPDVRDVYVCLSSQLQAEPKVSAKGRAYNKAIRSSQSAIALKAIFLDIDFKGGDNGYDNFDRALDALGVFISAAQLPKVSCMVHSGGGLHVYWTFADQLPVHEWQVLAFAQSPSTQPVCSGCLTPRTTNTTHLVIPSY